MALAIPAFKPKTPFVGLIPGGFQPSLMIRMKGKMIAKRGRCAIDFVSSPPQHGVNQDIMLHMSIRLDEKCIVRNSYKHKRWEMEERYGAFRISYYDPFEIVILAEHPHYKIAINGVHLGIFRHRLPLNLVQYIKISGDVEIEHVLLEQDVKSAQEAAALGYLINNISSFPPGTQYRIGSTTYVQPATANYAISSTATAVPAQVFPPGTQYNIGTTAYVQPATASHTISSTTTAVPAPGYPQYPIQQGSNFPQPNPQGVPYVDYQHSQQGNMYGSTSAAPSDPPPPYQPSAPPQNQTWVFKK